LSCKSSSLQKVAEIVTARRIIDAAAPREDDVTIILDSSLDRMQSLGGYAWIQSVLLFQLFEDSMLISRRASSSADDLPKSLSAGTLQLLWTRTGVVPA
jgi:hypothetical protein